MGKKDKKMIGKEKTSWEQVTRESNVIGTSDIESRGGRSERSTRHEEQLQGVGGGRQRPEAHTISKNICRERGLTNGWTTSIRPQKLRELAWSLLVLLGCRMPTDFVLRRQPNPHLLNKRPERSPPPCIDIELYCFPLLCTYLLPVRLNETRGNTESGCLHSIDNERVRRRRRRRNSIAKNDVRFPYLFSPCCRNSSIIIDKNTCIICLRPIIDLILSHQ